MGTDRWQAKKMTELGHYANHTETEWRMLFNKNVQFAGLRFSKFDVERDYDYLNVYHYYSSLFGPWRFTGQSSNGDPDSPTLGFVYDFWTLGSGSDTARLEFKWYTDSSVNYTGIKIDAIHLVCRGTPLQPQNTYVVLPNSPYQGYLLGTNDVIWIKVAQPAGYQMSLLLWPLDNSDFDIYASHLTEFPGVNFEWRGYRGGRKPELVEIPSFGSVGGGARWIYVSIGSYSGAGMFRFYANINKTRSLIAGTDWNPSAGAKETIRRILHKYTIAQYLASEGRDLIDHWEIRWNYPTYLCHDTKFYFRRDYTGGSMCDQPVANPETTCWYQWWQPPPPGNHIYLHTSDWCGCQPADTPGCTCTSDPAQLERRVLVMLHESGHCDLLYGLRDEYMSTYNCGHSLMSDQWTGYYANMTDYCVYQNGGEDSTSGHSNSENNWACFPSKLYSPNPVYPPVPSLTPDAFYKVDGEGDADFQPAATITEIQY